MGCDSGGGAASQPMTKANRPRGRGAKPGASRTRPPSRHKEIQMSRITIALPLAVAALFATAAPALAAHGDRDHDGMNDRWERRHHVSSPKADPDRDGLVNRAEFAAHTDPHRADTDADGVRDGDEDRDRDRVDNANEQRERTSPGRRDTNRNGRPDGREDADHDGLNNADEDRLGTDPIDADTDG